MGGRVTGQIDFGYDLNAALGGKGNHIGDFLLGVIAAVGRAVAKGLRPPGADLMEPGESVWIQSGSPGHR